MNVFIRQWGVNYRNQHRYSDYRLFTAETFHVIEMIIDTCSARPPALSFRRQPAEVAPIVVGPQKPHIVRNAQAGASSFRKIPRYFTEGSPCWYLPAFTNSAFCG